MRVCIVVDNDVVHDSRVLKVIKTLSKEHDLIIIGFWERKVRYKNLILANSAIYNISQIFINKVRNILNIDQESDFILNKNVYTLKSIIINLISDIIRHLRIKITISSINKELSKIKADVYHANDLPVLKICMRHAIKNKSRLIYDSHELYLEQGFFKTNFLYKKYYWEEKEGIQKADVVITVNEFIAKELKNRYNRNDIKVIYNYPRPKFKRNEIHKKKELCFLYQGGFVPGRGLKELILAMQFVPNNYKLYLRGMGSYEEVLKRLAKKIGLLNNKVFFLNPVSPDKLISVSSFADVGVLFYEPYCLNNYLASPNKLFEYINTPLAILCNSLPFLKKIVDTYNLGIYVEKIDELKIAEAILRFTPDNIVSYKLAALRAAQVLNWTSEEKKLYEIYSFKDK